MWTTALYYSCTRETDTPGWNRPSSALAVSSVKTRPQFACVCLRVLFLLLLIVVVVFFLSHILTVRCQSDDFIKLTSAADCVVWIRLGCSCSRWSFHVHRYILHIDSTTELILTDGGSFTPLVEFILWALQSRHSACAHNNYKQNTQVVNLLHVFLQWEMITTLEGCFELSLKIKWLIPAAPWINTPRLSAEYSWLEGVNPGVTRSVWLHPMRGHGWFVHGFVYFRGGKSCGTKERLRACWDTDQTDTLPSQRPKSQKDDRFADAAT